MRSKDLTTKIFLDSGDPRETKEALGLLGFLDGQTTNPSLFVKNPDVQSKINAGEKFSKEEIYLFYKKIVQDISALIPAGSVSVEVYADQNSSVDELLAQSREMNSWIPNAHIKLPITNVGLTAAELLVKEGIMVNMTLCFSQEQAAAVHSATRGAENGQVFVSPFVGRLDDRGENGMDLIKNIHEMYQSAASQVELLAASIRSYDHLLYCLRLGVDQATAPFKILKIWAEDDFKTPDDSYVYPAGELKPIAYQEFDLNKDWRKFDTSHALTAAGLQKFADDWNRLISDRRF